jgi:hypothetical protein
MTSAVNLKDLTPIELDRLSIEKGEVFAEEWRGGLYKCASCQNTLYRYDMNYYRALGDFTDLIQLFNNYFHNCPCCKR